jgi:hypothetical protein
MGEAFACPECGTTVEVRGVAPGRQVRCGFCQRLLEVPYLPRVEDKRWKRRRFGRPWWVPVAWCTLGFVSVLIVLFAMIRLLGRHERAAMGRTIQGLIASSESKERSGMLSEALVDLDTAINLCSQAEAPECLSLSTQLRPKRGALARQEARACLDQLSENRERPIPVGKWLNLQARTTADADLAPLKSEVLERFHKKLTQVIETDLKEARAAIEAGNATGAFDKCDALPSMLDHLPTQSQASLRREAEQIVLQVIARHGLFIEPPRGTFLRGSESNYNTTMIPAIGKAVRAKGYVPQPSSPAWRDRWSQAPFRLTLNLSERLEGNYMASENRLTRIDAQLSLYHKGKAIWKTTPTARTAVPLPNLPAYLATRLALSPARIEEFEHLLYLNARKSIDEKFAFFLSHIPPCGQQAVSSAL